MPTQLETAINRVVVAFRRFSTEEGAGNTLSRRELKTLLEDQLGDSIKGMKDPSYVNKIMEDLDENKDGQVDMQEFVTLVASLLVAYNQPGQPPV